jgi:putative methyltransferase (TIGR04325 family)
MTSVPVENQIFPSYAAALGCVGGIGYENKILVDVIVKKNLIFRNEQKKPPLFNFSAARTLFGVSLAANNRDKLRVVDFGGGGGFHYTIARAMLPPEIEISWNVVESPRLCRASDPLITPGLSFYDSIETASADLESVDLIFTSSALQYTPDPLKTLEELLKIKATSIYITRTPFSMHNESIVGIPKSRLADNGPGALPTEFIDEEIWYPITYVPIPEIENVLASQTNIRLKIIEDLGGLMFAGSKLNDYYGYYCDRK